MNLVRFWDSYFKTSLLVSALDDVNETNDCSLCSVPFVRWIPLTPSVTRTLLTTKDKRIHLGCLALMCWLDKVSAWHHYQSWLLEHHVNLDYLRTSINLCIYRGLRRKLRSTPYIGHHRKNLLAKAT